MLLRTVRYLNGVISSITDDTQRTDLMGYIYDSLNTNSTQINALVNAVFTSHNNIGGKTCKIYDSMFYNYALIYVSLIQLYYNKYNRSATRTSTDISFSSTTSPDTISTTSLDFVALGFTSDMEILVSGAANAYNNKRYSLLSDVEIKYIHLASDSLVVTEAAGATVTITGRYPTYVMYDELFNLTTMNERFNCHGISLNSIFNSFNLPINIFNLD